jgi:GMP synthase (glutamine-hydrolysing)
MSLNILIVEGNIPEDSEVFIRAAGASASENLKNLVLKLEPNTNVKIINPGKDEETKEALENIESLSWYHFYRWCNANKRYD